MKIKKLRKKTQKGGSSPPKGIKPVNVGTPKHVGNMPPKRIFGSSSNKFNPIWKRRQAATSTLGTNNRVTEYERQIKRATPVTKKPIIFTSLKKTGLLQNVLPPQKILPTQIIVPRLAESIANQSKPVANIKTENLGPKLNPELVDALKKLQTSQEIQTPLTEQVPEKIPAPTPTVEVEKLKQQEEVKNDFLEKYLSGQQTMLKSDRHNRLELPNIERILSNTNLNDKKKKTAIVKQLSGKFNPDNVNKLADSILLKTPENLKKMIKQITEKKGIYVVLGDLQSTKSESEKVTTSEPVTTKKENPYVNIAPVKQTKTNVNVKVNPIYAVVDKAQKSKIETMVLEPPKTNLTKKNVNNSVKHLLMSENKKKLSRLNNLIKNNIPDYEAINYTLEKKLGRSFSNTQIQNIVKQTKIKQNTAIKAANLKPEDITFIKNLFSRNGKINNEDLEKRMKENTDYNAKSKKRILKTPNLRLTDYKKHLIEKLKTYKASILDTKTDVKENIYNTLGIKKNPNTTTTVTPIYSEIPDNLENIYSNPKIPVKSEKLQNKINKEKKLKLQNQSIYSTLGNNTRTSLKVVGSNNVSSQYVHLSNYKSTNITGKNTTNMTMSSLPKNENLYENSEQFKSQKIQI